MPSVRQVLFIQGGGADAHDDWDAKLVDSLRIELGEGYEVRYPRLPQEDEPSYARWSAAIGHELAAIHEDAIVVGHSVGGTILANYLTAVAPPARLAMIVLIAAPFVGAGGWPGHEFDLPGDLGARLPQGVPVHLFHGLDDQTVPRDHIDLYSRAIPQAQLHRLPGRDHQFNDDLREVARVISAASREGDRSGSIAAVTSVPHDHHSHQHTEGDSDTRLRWLAAEWSFISTALPPAPARLLEIGCGAAGGIVPAALAAGYAAVGVDPNAPDGSAYRQVPFETYDPPSPFDIVVSVQALHHLANLDAAVERIDRVLAPDAVLVIVEWAWERIDDATARWLFDRVPTDANSGWAGERRDNWRTSGLPWSEYRDRWAHEHGLHSWDAVEFALAHRFDTVLREDVPSLFGDVAEISEETERAAIAAAEISTTGIHWVGRRHARIHA